MGHVVVEAKLAGTRQAKVRMLVDTGATWSVLPRDLAERLGALLSNHFVTVTLADGRRRRMQYGLVHVRLAGRDAGATILVGPRGAQPLLGMETLEALGLMVDPRSRKLRQSRAHGLLLVGYRTHR